MVGCVAVVVVVAATTAMLLGGTAHVTASGDNGTAPATGLRWSAPHEVDAGPPFGPSNHLTALACPTTSLCVAGDAAGQVLVASASRPTRS